MHSRIWTVVLTVTLSAPRSGMGQERRSSVDSLVASAARLSGCYQFVWQDTTPGRRLPRHLDLTTNLQRQLGYHKPGFFDVRPNQVSAGSYVVWRPLGGDSLEVELTATPTLSPKGLSLSGVVVGDTLSGVLVEWTSTAESGQTRDIVRFDATRGSKCP